VKAYSIILLLFVLSFGNLYSQDVSKIDLNNVNVDTKRLPTIFLFGEEFTARDRDELLRGILKSQFHKPDLEIVINLQEFISKRSFSFRHKGSVDVIIDGKRLRNQNRYNNTSLYSSGSDTSLVNLINEVTNVRIDSNINGILKRRVIRKELKSIEDQISKFMENIGAEFENDTLFVNIKSQEKALKKFYRIKNRHEKKLNETKLIEINIITN
jgi:hypothetical protein|tara:strand:- start:167 stop:805 length:639 start_codon:yes stop_codon:yes gene_type:complete